MKSHSSYRNTNIAALPSVSYRCCRLYLCIYPAYCLSARVPKRSNVISRKCAVVLECLSFLVKMVITGFHMARA